MKNQKLTRPACYAVNVTMSAFAVLSPMLFLTFHELYGISYTLLGTLVLINFCTQLGIDLVFSFFSHLFNIRLTVRLLPLITAVGLLIYAILPPLFPSLAYLFLAVGTVIASLSAGLAEVLISPVVAALPSDDPERDMSILHSVYAWGVAVVVLLNTLFLQFVSYEKWYILPLLWTAVPLCAAVLFAMADIPSPDTASDAKNAAGIFRNPLLILCVACIFLGGAAENTMTQWISGYLEAAVGLDKLWGDVCGTALFAVMLGLGRSLYARYGKRIDRVLFAGFAGAVICYVTAALSHNAVVGLAACALTGFCVSMLWPGTLIRTAELLPATGVAVYALLAAGGDLGGSVGPQLVGSLTDFVAENGLCRWIGPELTSEQLGFRAGMLCAALFPLCGIIVVLVTNRLAQNKMDTRNIKTESEEKQA